MLGQPKIVNKLTECSRGIELVDLVAEPGVRVSLRAANGAIEDWPVSNTTQFFDFSPGRHLTEKESVFAVQFRTGEDGIPSDWADVGGWPAATDLDKGFFATPLYECGECILLFGLFPGADVQISYNGKPLAPVTVSPNGQAYIHLPKPLNPADVLSAVQTAGASMGKPITSTKPIVPTERIWPRGEAAVIQTEVKEIFACETELRITKIYPGASVIVSRASKGSSTTCVAAAPVTVTGYSAFQGGETIAIGTVLPQCNPPQVGSDFKTVVNPNPPTAPTLPPIVCADASEILLAGLDGPVKLEVSIATLGRIERVLDGSSGNAKYFRFATSGFKGAPKIEDGSVITVRQSKCGGVLNWSPPAIVKVKGGPPATPTLQTPANNTVVSTLTPTLTWIDTGTPPCTQGFTYHVRIWNEYGKSVFNSSGWTSKSALVAGYLTSGSKYLWSVRAYRGASVSPSDWSAMFMFQTFDREKTETPGGTVTPTAPGVFAFCKTTSGYSQTIYKQANSWEEADKAVRAENPNFLIMQGEC